MALAAAIAFTGRTKIIAFKNGYHGGTLSFPASLHATNVNLPHEFILAPYNDIPGTKEVLVNLPKDSVAAIIVEPIQGSGGCVVGSVEFLQYLNAISKKMGSVFIVDEVMTSRLSYHGYSSSIGLSPDLITLGKWIGGGMTFGAFGGRKDAGIMSMFDPRFGHLSHSGTFNNNILTMAAGCAGLEIYNADQVTHLNALGEDLKGRIAATLVKYGIGSAQGKIEDGSRRLDSLSLSENSKSSIKHTMWISGQGSMLNIHFAGEREKSLRAIFWHHMLDQGIYLAQRGFVALNIELNEVHIRKFTDAIESFIERYQHILQ